MEGKGWFGGKGRKVRHKHPGDYGEEGGKGVLRRHLSLVHRGERHNLQGHSVDSR